MEQGDKKDKLNEKLSLLEEKEKIDEMKSRYIQKKYDRSTSTKKYGMDERYRSSAILYNWGYLLVKGH